MLKLAQAEIDILSLFNFYTFWHKATGVDRIPSKLIQAGGGKLYKDIHKLIALIWNQKELPQEEKESIIAAIHKKGNRIDCNNCRGISLLSTSYKIFSNTLLIENDSIYK